MKLKLKEVFSILLLSAVLVACGGEQTATESPPAITEETLVEVEPTATDAPVATEAPIEEAIEEAIEEPIEEPTATSEPVAEAEATAETEAQEQTLPLYLSAELLDVNHGESFRIADLTGQGKYVLVEMMAVW